MKKLINFIRSDSGLALFTVLALLVMIVHTALVFYITSGGGYLSAVLSGLFSLAIDMAILLFVLRGRTRISYAFSLFQVAMNVAHFLSVSKELTWISLVISVALPLVIALYSHEIARAEKVALDSKIEEVKLENLISNTELAKQMDTNFREVGDKIDNYLQPLFDELASITEEQRELQTRVNKVENRVSYTFGKVQEKVNPEYKHFYDEPDNAN